MYTDDDLEQAVVKNIFSREQVEGFRNHILASKNTQLADEENFKLLSSFNDIFVVMACALLLGSVYWLFQFNHQLGMVVMAVLSWGLAEFFVRKRKMALPAIVLLLSFLLSVFFSIAANIHYTADESTVFIPIVVACVVTMIAAWLHWRRFRVPITIAVGGAVAAGLFAFYLIPVLVNAVFPSDMTESIRVVGIILCGILVFGLAMWWDSQDLRRVTRKSDIAFWCHLVAAPMIVHPIFSSLGIFDGNQSPLNLAIVLLLYLALSFISLVIDRRAFIVPSLVYVIYAFTDVLEHSGLKGEGFAYVGIVIALSLLLLSGFWHKARVLAVKCLPSTLQRVLPPISD